MVWIMVGCHLQSTVVGLPVSTTGFIDLLQLGRQLLLIVYHHILFLHRWLYWRDSPALGIICYVFFAAAIQSLNCLEATCVGAMFEKFMHPNSNRFFFFLNFFLLILLQDFHKCVLKLFYCLLSIYLKFYHIQRTLTHMSGDGNRVKNKAW